MSTPRFLVTAIPSSGPLELGENEARHASNVLRLSEGDAVVIFDGRGGEAVGTLAHVQKRAASVVITQRTNTNRELPCELEMLVALPKGDRQKTLVDGLVQLGATQLTPLSCQRGVAQAHAGAVQRLGRTIIETSKQCGRNQLMRIGQPLSVAELVGQDPEANVLQIFAHPYSATTALADLSPTLPGSETLPVCRFLIGPEGGLTDEEVELLRQAAWTQVHLGPRILRIEMASFMVAAWWSSQFK